MEGKICSNGQIYFCMTRNYLVEILASQSMLNVLLQYSDNAIRT